LGMFKTLKHAQSAYLLSITLKPEKPEAYRALSSHGRLP